MPAPPSRSTRKMSQTPTSLSGGSLNRPASPSSKPGTNVEQRWDRTAQSHTPPEKKSIYEEVLQGKVQSGRRFAKGKIGGRRRGTLGRQMTDLKNRGRHSTMKNVDWDELEKMFEKISEAVAKEPTYMPEGHPLSKRSAGKLKRKAKIMWRRGELSSEDDVRDFHKIIDTLWKKKTVSQKRANLPPSPEGPNRSTVSGIRQDFIKRPPMAGQPISEGTDNIWLKRMGMMIEQGRRPPSPVQKKRKPSSGGELTSAHQRLLLSLCEEAIEEAKKLPESSWF